MKKSKVINLFGNTEIRKTEGKKYSVLLEGFIAEFKNEFSNYDSLEEVIDFGIVAWNYGNMKVLIPDDDFNKIIETAPDKNFDFSLLKKMIAYKVEKFKKYTNFIIDFELEEVSGDPILRLITQKEDDYVSNMLNDMEQQFAPEDFEENYINRSAIIVKPLQPFFDWLNALYPEDEIDSVGGSNSYLINQSITDIEAWLKKKYDTIFMLELNDWDENKKNWPQKRNYKMFKQWFKVDISSMVYDLEKEPINKSE